MGCPLFKPDCGRFRVKEERRARPEDDGERRSRERRKNSPVAASRERAGKGMNDDRRAEKPESGSDGRREGGKAAGEAGEEGARKGALQRQRNAEEVERSKGKERRSGDGFMLAGDDAEGRNEKKNCAVRNRAPVDSRFRLAAKREGDGLRFISSCEPVGAVPEGGRRERKPEEACEPVGADFARKPRKERGKEGGNPAAHGSRRYRHPGNFRKKPGRESFGKH